MERGLRSRLACQDRKRLVAKNSAARIAVERVSTLAVPRLDRKPPPPPPPLPMPRPPPSDFWLSTRPTMASTIIRWMRITTVCIRNLLKRGVRAGGPRHDPRYRNSGRCLHDPLAHFHPAPALCRKRG